MLSPMAPVHPSEAERLLIASQRLLFLAQLDIQPAQAVERYYSSSLYPIWQSWVTTISNAAPIAFFDVLIAAIAAVLIVD